MTQRILIVEDDSNILISLTFLMEQCGYETRGCEHGRDAITLAAAFRPHLILLDIMLPGCNGYEVCRALRASDENRQTKIVVLSAKGREAELAKARLAGADTYLIKPFSTREVIDTVRRLVEAS